MYEDCSKYKKRAIIGFVLLAIFLLYTRFASEYTIFKINDILVILLGIIIFITSNILFSPYLQCLFMYKNKKG